MLQLNTYIPAAVEVFIIQKHQHKAITAHKQLLRSRIMSKLSSLFQLSQIPRTAHRNAQYCYACAVRIHGSYSEQDCCSFQGSFHAEVQNRSAHQIDMIFQFRS